MDRWGRDRKRRGRKRLAGKEGLGSAGVMDGLQQSLGKWMASDGEERQAVKQSHLAGGTG